MNSMQSTSFRSNEESRSTCNEDPNTYSVLNSRNEEEKQRRRREWQRQQERERQHEKLKQDKIREYERKRAQSLIKYAEEKHSRHSRSKSGSTSPSHLRYRSRFTSTASKSGSLHEKLEGPTSGTVSLFRGPQNAPIETKKLRRIKVDIHRNISVKVPVTEIERDILDPEDVIVKRREGEGCKPIFDREEIKQAVIKTNEVEELRTVVAVDKEQSASTSKSHTLRKRSLSLNPIRKRIYGSGYLSSYQSRRSSVEKRRDYRGKYVERDASNHDSKRSHSRERDPRNSYSRSFTEERFYRNRYRERSSERSHERKDRDRDRDRNRNRDRDRDRDRNRDRDRDKNKDRGRSRERRETILNNMILNNQYTCQLLWQYSSETDRSKSYGPIKKTDSSL